MSSAIRKLCQGLGITYPQKTNCCALWQIVMRQSLPSSWLRRPAGRDRSSVSFGLGRRLSRSRLSVSATSVAQARIASQSRRSTCFSRSTPPKLPISNGLTSGTFESARSSGCRECRKASSSFPRGGSGRTAATGIAASAVSGGA